MKRNVIHHLFFSLLFVFVSFSSRAQSWNITGNNNTNATSKLGTTTAEPLNLTTNNVTRLTIFPTGQSGFGANVTAANSTRVLNLVDGNAVMRILRVHPTFAPAIELLSRTTPDGPNVAYWDAYTEPSDASFRIRDRIGGGAGLDRLTVNSSGFVGIGTTAPSNQLDVQSTSAFGQFKALLGSAGLILDKSAANQTAAIFYRSGGSNVWRVGTSGNNNFHIANLSGIGGNGLTVNANTNNVGIGTNSPESKLHVSKGSAGAITPNANAPLVVENDAASYINLLAPQATETGILFGNSGNVQDGGIVYLNSTDAMQFRTNGNITRMTLSSTGNLDIAGGTVSFGSVETLADAGSFTISSNSDIVPTSDNTRRLGRSGLRWSEVWAADGTINTSDARLKTNIRDLEYGLKEIMKLRSTRFNWKSRAGDGDKLGLIAQDLKAVLPEVVRDWEFTTDEQTGEQKKVPSVHLGVAYADIIPVLVKGMQEQQGIIEKQQQQIDELRQLVHKFANGQTNANVDGNALLQNAPNPVRNTTTIRYSLPAGAGNAQLLLTDALGRTIKVIRLNDSGLVSVDVSSLSAGVYNYSLVIDGKTLQTRKMNVVRQY